jgi:excisionase family DNA binding protein
MKTVEIPPDSPESTHAAPVLLSVKEACRTLKISKWSLYRLIHTDQLRTIRIGRRRLVPGSAIQTLIQRLDGEDIV